MEGLESASANHGNGETASSPCLLLKFSKATTMKTETILGAALVSALAFTATFARAQDPLPSWNDGKAKRSIINFVEKVTNEGSPDFVPVAERIATFDNDGTLWSEQPMPVQLYFALDRVKALAPQHPEWKTRSRSPPSSRAT